MASRIEERLETRANGSLRSIVAYERGKFDVVYLRDDVAAQYSEDEFADAIDGSRLDSLYAPNYEESFGDDHGDLVCLVQVFENVVEVNVALDDGVGVAVALDGDATDDLQALVSDVRSAVPTERT